ncbi:hypothetical protein B0O80DRAFT_427898 [Mortierella sp. GBAus27b]|nr:hypothetical protein B0O80DRAFT_427898 [Mortierella sp. GBAus27b]
MNVVGVCITIEIHPEHPPTNDESQAHDPCHRILGRHHIRYLRTLLLSMLECTGVFASTALKRASKQPALDLLSSHMKPRRFIDSTQNTSVLMVACIITVVGSLFLNTVPGTIDWGRKERLIGPRHQVFHR